MKICMGGGSKTQLGRRLYSFRVIQIYICWHGTAIYGIGKLFRFFIEIFWRILNNTRLERASKWNMKHNYDLSSHNGSPFQFRAAHILNIFLLQTLPPNDLFTCSSLSFWTKTNLSSWISQLRSLILGWCSQFLNDFSIFVPSQP